MNYEDGRPWPVTAGRINDPMQRRPVGSRAELLGHRRKTGAGGAGNNSQENYTKWTNEECFQCFKKTETARRPYGFNPFPKVSRP